MNPLPKAAGIIGTIVALLGVLAASNTVTAINDIMTAVGASASTQHAVGLVLATIGSVVTLFSHAPSANSDNAPLAK